MAKYKYGFNLEDVSHQEEIAKEVSKLPKHVQIVIAWRYGFLGSRSGASVRDLARQLGKTKAEIEAALNEGCRILHSVFAARPTTRLGRARKLLGV